MVMTDSDNKYDNVDDDNEYNYNDKVDKYDNDQW